jgi:hypothetical protein
MERFSDIIDLWPKPSNRRFAEDIGVSANSLRVMRHRNRVASSYFPSIVAAAARRGLAGVTYERLFAIQTAGQAAGVSPLLQEPVPANG